MVYDLNVPWTPSTLPTDLERTITFLSSLGYTTLALTHTLNASTLPSQLANPIPLTLTTPSKTTLLRRCTLLLSDPAQNPRLSALASTFDILAIRPTTEAAFQAACVALPEFSMISLDLTQHYNFHFKPKPLMAAVNRGIRFEICYAQATAGDSAKRRNFIANTLAIIRATRGRGLVLSSEAQSAVAARAPADVLNLMGVWGLGRERGLEALGVNPRAVVVNEGMKRSAFRGVVDVVYGGEKAIEKSKENEKGKGKQGGQNTDAINKKGKAKRTLPNPDVEGAQPISKRQAKRMKLEALKAEKEGKASVKSNSELESKGTSTPEILDTTNTKPIPP
jgi:ribonuclease P/MRP protein subunit RPP1